MARQPEHSAVARDVIQRIELERDAMVSLCSRFVAARSVNPLGDTRAMADVVVDALRGFGVEGRLEREVDSMPSVVAELDSGRPGPHLVLNVHLDTMPAGDENAWSVDPWTLTRKDGRLYGLGMGNMKGAVAAMVYAVGMLAERSELWEGRITFTAVSDEVVFGDHGAAYLLMTHPNLVGEGMICGEGAGFRRLALGEKGVLWLGLVARGDAGHSSSAVKGETATARLARAILAIDELTGTRGSLPESIPVAQPETALTLTTNVGTISGGIFVGQRAVRAEAEVDLRIPPGITVDEVEASVRSIVGRGVDVYRIKGWDPNVTLPESSVVRAWRRAESDAGFAPAEAAIRLPASDASRWRARGTPALCFGPQPGLSAGIDDYAEEDEVLRCAALYTLAALRFLSTGKETP